MNVPQLSPESVWYGGPLLARAARVAGGALVWVERIVWTLFFAFALLLLALRYAILPNVENYRADIEQALTSNAAVRNR